MVDESRPAASLSEQALKVARRIDALPPGRSYRITLTKPEGAGREWLLTIGPGEKVEHIK